MQIGTILRNRYRILQKLGSGSFGETYLAEDGDLPGNPKCVVKHLKSKNNPRAMSVAKRLFDTEAATLYKLGKKNEGIPELFAHFEEGGEFYLVQEYIDGEDLSKEVTPGKRLGESEVRELLVGILEPLEVAHRQKVIHRDIKPENLIRRREDGKIVLIDFGAVKEIATSIVGTAGQTNMTINIGTPGYLPPEQAMGKPKLSSDIYAVGMLGIYALTGVLPPTLPKDEETGEVVWRDLVSVSKDLGDVLDKMVRSNFSYRYANATEALTALLSPKATTTQTFTTVKVNSRGEIIKRLPGKAEVFTENLGGGMIFFGGGVTLEMVSIPGGRFLMGSPENEEGRRDYESPQHSVDVPPFFMGKHPVTQPQYEAVMGNNPSGFKGPKRPVEMVSWNDATEFCQKLSQRTGKTYRLPSEAEWEYACRARTTTPFYFGPTITAELANYDGTSTYASEPKRTAYRRRTTDVGSFPANAFGLYDMHGNVWEWCQDAWHDNYNGAPSDGSAWESGEDGSQRLQRGGSWNADPRNCRCALRLMVDPGGRLKSRGFRVVLVPGL